MDIHENMNEDIFNDDDIDITIRFDTNRISNLKYRFKDLLNKLKEMLKSDSYHCYFRRKKENVHSIIIPIANEHKNIELLLEWQPSTFDYKAVINSTSKYPVQAFNNITSDIYTIDKECVLSFISLKDAKFPNKEQEKLHDAIEELNISPKLNIENQLEIWKMWIEAQKLLIDKNAKPIDIEGYHTPSETKSGAMQFSVKLPDDTLLEYKSLEDRLKRKPFNINEKIKKDGTLSLAKEDICNGLDIILQKDFKDVIIRDEKISCVLKLNSFIHHNGKFNKQNSACISKRLERQIYALNFDVKLNEKQKSLKFEFTNQEELELRCRIILDLLTDYTIITSPLDNHFKFKVKLLPIAQKSKREIFEEKLKDLSRVEFYVKRELDKLKKYEKITIGNLLYGKSSYKSLVFNLPYKRNSRQIEKFKEYIKSKPNIQNVTPNLRGDEVKISWLNDAMTKVFDPHEGLDTTPINKNLRDFVFDSSKAEEIYKKMDNKECLNDLKRHELLNLNPSQRKAVFSALYSNDLALLQGPPGTGKTTVIAEMIWQMVRNKQNQKILLTSETNLAVDNALEKLSNKRHTLVKPIRFGRTSKFEEEGKKYSLERILKWIDKNESVDDSYENEDSDDDLIIDTSNDEISNNAVQLWMRRIADNSQQSNSKYSEVMKDWAFEMAQPSKDMKLVFKEKYFEHCNVIGSTSSSAGSPNFSADYQRIYNNTGNHDFEIGDYTLKVKYEIKKYNTTSTIVNGINCLNLIKNIEFDTVITDEASKATPPELLLPMCFGHKNVIIGDHRQLPPMLHDKSFKEMLESLHTDDALDLAQNIDVEFVETSQFERLISNPNVSPTIKSSFNEQYRMHPHINNVIKQFYLDDGGLEPGEPLLNNADDSNLDNPFSRYHGFRMNNFINPDIHTIWVNVDDPEEKSGTSRINKTEVNAVELILKMLKKSKGFSNYMKHWNELKDINKRKEEKEVGIISFYGSQVGMLKDVANDPRRNLGIPIRLNTVDKFQGMERNIIIVSTVRSNTINDNGTIKMNYNSGFAKSPKRLNVALSRAKRLLIIVGNIDFFSKITNQAGEKIYKNVVDIIQKEGKVIDYKELKKEFDK